MVVWSSPRIPSKDSDPKESDQIENHRDGCQRILQRDRMNSAQQEQAKVAKKEATIPQNNESMEAQIFM